MNTQPFSPDDPQLTAYALGELDEAERAAVEARLRDDPAARAAVSAIRATARQLETALADELLPEVRPVRSAPRRRLGRIIRLPQLYYATATLAAACFVVLVAVRGPEVKPPAAAPVEVMRKEQDAAVLAKRERVELESASTAVDARRQHELSAAAAVRENEAKARMAPPPAAVAKVPVTDQATGATKVYGSLAAKTSTGSRIGMEAQRIPAATPMMLSLGVAAEPVANTEAYAYQPETGFVEVAQNPLSTFAIDVDTASYANVRRFLNQDQRPPADAVRIEELLNYFPYRYAPPVGADPLGVTLEVAAAPWAPDRRLVRVGLKAREVSTGERPAANLVFLLDVSGSMNHPNKLPLVQESLRLLVARLRPDDRVAIVTYAGSSGLALPSTLVARAAEILAAVADLRPGGSTNGALGIQLAYDIAKANFIGGGLNRVVLCTDGDFNVGVTSEGDLVRLIEEKAKSGVFLTVLGFGMGNYKDATLERLADKGNGHYGYIDSKREAEKLLVAQVNGTLVTVAKDVKVQVEFNPARVAAYRLIGYENRRLAKEDFNNDAVDAGELGAGHTVTALYEVVPAGQVMPGAAPVDALKYQKTEDREQLTDAGGELLTVKVRFKEPAGDVSRKREFPLIDSGLAFTAASSDFKFAAAVAGFGMVLRESPYRGTATLADVTTWAQAGLADDAGGYRSEFLTLVGMAERLTAPNGK